MRVIKKLDGRFIVKDGLRFLEGDTMLVNIQCRFHSIPFELDHTYIVLIQKRLSSAVGWVNIMNPNMAGATAMLVHERTA